MSMVDKLFRISDSLGEKKMVIKNIIFILD
jgi:hypothetical protein